MSVERVVGFVAFALVAGAVAIGFATIGPPQHMRLMELDRQRLDDLRSLAYGLHLGEQASGTNRLPERLVDLDDPHPRRRDPQTGIPYEYHRESARRYRLCATFALPSDSDGVEPHWAHGAGRTCFRFDAYQEAEPLGEAPRESSAEAPSALLAVY